MYAIIRDSSKQYRVEKDMVLDIDLKDRLQPGEEIEFDEVLYLGGDGEPVVGAPTIPNAKVIAEVKGESKGKKVEIMYWRKRKSSRTHKGHRQKYTKIAIKDIIT